MFQCQSPEKLTIQSPAEIANWSSPEITIHKIISGETSTVKELNRIGTKIPKPAIKKCISATLMVLLGNAYKKSFDAIEPAEDILQKLS